MESPLEPVPLEEPEEDEELDDELLEEDDELLLELDDEEDELLELPDSVVTLIAVLLALILLAPS
jgi:hypothetical protein